MTEVVPWVPYMFVNFVQVVSERVVGYSFDQFGGQPALDRIALAPGSPEARTAGTMPSTMSEHTERLEDLTKRIDAAKEFL